MEKNLFKNLIFVDIETTGAQPYENQILSLTLLPYDDKLPSLNLFIEHEKYVWNEIAKKYFNKYRDVWEKEKVNSYNACLRFNDYMKNLPLEEYFLVGHNVGFDYSFIKGMFYREHLSILKFSHRSIDTYTLLHSFFLQKKLPQTILNSSAAFEYFKISPEENSRHTSLGDCIATKKLFIELIDFNQEN